MPGFKKDEVFYFQAFRDDTAKAQQVRKDASAKAMRTLITEQLLGQHDNNEASNVDRR